MQEAKHTPGPWAVEQGERFHAGNTVITARHAGLRPDSPLAHVSNILGVEEALPDARLIAAAPELLEALQTMLQTSGDVENYEWAEELARSAIAKATAAEGAA